MRGVNGREKKRERENEERALSTKGKSDETEVMPRNDVRKFSFS